MSGKTKIVVLHMKELIYTGIFAALGILFIILLIIMFLPGKQENNTFGNAKEDNSGTAVTSESVYIPGIYTTELLLGGQTVDVEVIVEKDSISSIRMVNLSESVTTMYPLLQPTFDSLCEQIYTNQSLEEITYTADSKYTSLVIMDAIQSSLSKARPTTSPTPATTATPSGNSTNTPATTTPGNNTITSANTPASSGNQSENSGLVIYQ